ncbi:uncharacterized protein LOC143373248 [Andrena cerasifolii]|uniref:uncharacterized protein LOC143373248 n=1 Tax=Andrena cerasifolii TaxID=2819439 RepID=UPI004037E32F
MPRNLSEADRKKNQFDKEERVHLLGIMKQYAPLLDSSASTLARKRIWTTIEEEFKKAGFVSKTSAQLKKYWQNYKYHCKKARALGKVSAFFPVLTYCTVLPSVLFEIAAIDGKLLPSEGNDPSALLSRTNVEETDRRSSSYCEKFNAKFNIDIPGGFAFRDISGAVLRFEMSEGTKQRIDLEMNDSSEWNRYQVFVENRSTSKYSEIPGVCSQSSQIQPGCRSTEIYEDKAGSSRKLNTSDGLFDLSWIKTERTGEESMPNCDQRAANLSQGINPKEDSLGEKKEIFMNKDRGSSSSSSSSSSSASAASATDRETRNRIVVSSAKISNNSVTVSIVYPEDNERACKSAVAAEACASKVTLPARKSADVSRFDREERRNREDSSDSCNLVGHSSIGDLKERTADASIEKSDTAPADRTSDSVYERQAREFFQRNGAATLMENQEIDAVARPRSLETRSDPFGPRGYVFLTNYRNQLKHKLLLQQLETEEKRLKVKIAEMAIQEVQLRIEALNEDMRRTEELHRLHLARAATGSVNF